MALEASTTISGLVSTNPPLGDPLSQADDHLRLIKSVLKTQFPGVAGQGFAIPITAKETELNFLSGVTAAIQTQLNNCKAIIPTGTVMAFFQAAAPAGWTKVTTHNNKMLRVVSGTGGGSGGVDSPILNDKVVSHTHVVTVSSDAHTHTFSDTSSTESVSHTHIDSGHTHPGAPASVYGFQAGGTAGFGGGIYVNGTGTANLGNATATHTHNVSGTTSSDSHTHTATAAVPVTTGTWQPLYLDMILCSKNAVA